MCALHATSVGAEPMRVAIMPLARHCCGPAQLSPTPAPLRRALFVPATQVFLLTLQVWERIYHHCHRSLVDWVIPTVNSMVMSWHRELHQAMRHEPCCKHLV